MHKPNFVRVLVIFKQVVAIEYYNFLNKVKCQILPIDKSLNSYYQKNHQNVQFAKHRHSSEPSLICSFFAIITEGSALQQSQDDTIKCKKGEG